MRRVDRQKKALPDRRSDQPTDTASYRGALSHLKRVKKLELRVLAPERALNGSPISINSFLVGFSYISSTRFFLIHIFSSAHLSHTFKVFLSLFSLNPPSASLTGLPPSHNSLFFFQRSRLLVNTSYADAIRRRLDLPIV